MGIEELRQVAPGQILGDITVRLANMGVQTVCTLKEGIIPEGTHLAEEDADAFFALDPTTGKSQAIAAVEQHDIDNEAVIALEPLVEGAKGNVQLLKGLTEIALRESNVPKSFDAVLDPESVETLDDAVLRKIGFVATPSGVFVFESWQPASQPVQAVVAA